MQMNNKNKNLEQEQKLSLKCYQKGRANHGGTSLEPCIQEPEAGLP